MAPFLVSDYGNPSSAHWAGTPARRALDDARSDVATLLGASTDEIVFTSGGSEANNTALKGVFFSRRATVDAPHVITTQVEHPAILTPCRFLESLGARVTRLPVDATGLVDPTQVRDAVTSQTVLVSVMHANNEVGTVQPIAEIGAITRARHPVPHRRRADNRQARNPRRRPRRRSAEHRRSQVLCAQGRRRAVCEARAGPGAARPRRRARRRTTGGHGERAARGGAWRRVPACGGTSVCRSARGGDDPFLGTAPRHVWTIGCAQRPPEPAPTKHVERELSGTEWAGGARAPRGGRGVDRLRLSQRIGCHVARAAGDGV